MQLNLSLFEFNNNCGYLLKPEHMRRKDRQFDPFAHNTIDGVVAAVLTIKVSLLLSISVAINRYVTNENCHSEILSPLPYIILIMHKQFMLFRASKRASPGFGVLPCDQMRLRKTIACNIHLTYF